MTQPDPHSPARTIGYLAVIAGVVVLGAGSFAYAAGWLSPSRLTPTKLVSALAPTSGPALGHRRNHAKGVCFSGVFEANGTGTEVSRAGVFARGTYPVLGRFNLGTPDPDAPDATVRVRGMGLQITAPDGAVWRTAMINLPFFPVATPMAFYDLLKASHSSDPGAMASFTQAHPEFARFGGWAKSAPWTTSYAEEAYNSLDAFLFVDASGARHPVRWSLLPQAPVSPVTNAELTRLGPNHLEPEITARVGQAPQRWTFNITLANPGDETDDPSKAWGPDRRMLTVGTLIVSKIEPERDGPCRDINFDPTILPDGIAVSDDPFPAARSAAYARSYDLRASETQYYPYHLQTAKSSTP